MGNDEVYNAVIVAAGSGARMGADIPKQFISLNGKTILERAAEPFISDEKAKQVVIVVSEDYEPLTRELFVGKNKVQIINGGKERRDSVYNALNFLKKEQENLQIPVLIHDGARPFVSKEIINNVRKAALTDDGAVCAVKLKDTVRDINKGTLKRDDLRAVQTPQGFLLGKLIDAYEKTMDCKVTDDAGVMELAGGKVNLVEGDYSNIKITTPEDLKMDYRIGKGFDVHRLVDDRDLILGGINIPFEKGLLGHSDADVLIHAFMDSMLGAAAMGDIGKLFPDTDDKYKGISSMELLREVSYKMAENGYSLVNTDITVICQKPKLRPYIDLMRENIAKAIDVDLDRISIKATTTEKLGYTGRGEGIAAEAVTLLSCYK